MVVKYPFFYQPNLKTEDWFKILEKDKRSSYHKNMSELTIPRREEETTFKNNSPYYTFVNLSLPSNESKPLDHIMNEVYSTPSPQLSPFVPMKTTSSSSVTNCEPDWTRLGSSCYKIFRREFNWRSAEDYCQSMGGHLVTVSSKSVSEFLNDFINEK